MHKFIHFAAMPYNVMQGGQAASKDAAMEELGKILGEAKSRAEAEEGAFSSEEVRIQ